MDNKTRERVGKLILMLGSSSDGEALAAARALVRALVEAGTDLHWLAARVAAPAPAAPGRSGRAREAPSAADWARAASYGRREEGEYRDHDRVDPHDSDSYVGMCRTFVEEIKRHSVGRDLSSRERIFVDQIAERLEQYGERTRISPAQNKWLRDIYERVVLT